MREPTPPKACHEVNPAWPHCCFLAIFFGLIAMGWCGCGSMFTGRELVLLIGLGCGISSVALGIWGLTRRPK